MERLHSSNAAKARLTAGVVAAAEMKTRRARSTAAAFNVRLTAAEEHAAALAATAREALQDKKRLVVKKCRMKKKGALKDGKVLGLLERRTETLCSYMAESEKSQLEAAKLESEGADLKSRVNELKADNAILHGQWWGQASKDAAFLLNRFPTSAKLVSPDGDAIRPLECLTGGVVSRRQIDKELDAYVTLGTLCLVHNEGTKGSQLASKVKYGVSYGMIGAINNNYC
jgi:hypothetical protein